MRLILNLLKGGEYSPYMYGSDRSRSQRDSYRLAQELNDLHIKVIILCFLIIHLILTLTVLIKLKIIVGIRVRLVSAIICLFLMFDILSRFLSLYQIFRGSCIQVHFWCFLIPCSIL